MPLLCFFALTDFKHFLLGLQSEHIPPAAVERPSVSLQRIPGWLPGPGSLYVGLHLEAWFVLCQWEGSTFPRGHYWQQALENIQKWKRPLFNQVRFHSHMHLKTFCSITTVNKNVKMSKMQINLISKPWHPFGIHTLMPFWAPTVNKDIIITYEKLYSSESFNSKFTQVSLIASMHAHYLNVKKIN